MSAEVKVEKKVVCSPFDRIHKTAAALRPGISYVYLSAYVVRSTVCHSVEFGVRRLIRWKIPNSGDREALCVGIVRWKSP